MSSILARKKVLGDYQVGKTIGQGAFSKVKLGYHKETGQKVAIKIIDKKQVAAKAAKAKKAQDERDRKQKAEEAKRQGNGGNEGNGNNAGPVEKPADVDENGNADGDITNAGNVDVADGPGKEEKPVPKFVSQLQLEVQLLMRLDHPNVIRLYQVMETEDECFVVMEYAQGGELIEYIAARGHLNEKEARRYFRQIVSAMDHCHLANVVHRDLKLENLLLNGERNILISDFGLGRTYSTDSEELMKTFCGTPNYAAVELISGIPYVGVKSDIWAMGVVLYVMMTGRPPFVGENISALYSKIKAVDYKCPDYFSQGLRQLLAKILVKDPRRRIDMDGIRDDAWLNYEEVEKPLRIYPKVMGSADASQISQFISGITYDQTFVIYTFRRHTRDGNSVYGANGTAHISQAQKRDIQRRKSLSIQNGGKGMPAAPASAQETVPEEGGDKVADLPLPSRSRTLTLTRGRRKSVDSAATNNRPAIPDFHTKPEPDIIPKSRQRRNTAAVIITQASQEKRARSPGSPDMPQRAKGGSASAVFEGGFANRHRRQSSFTSGMTGGDRETSVVRRMSMVSPVTDGEAQDSARGATPADRRGSIMSNAIHRLSQSSTADDPDPMLLNDPMQPPLFPTGQDMDDDLETLEPSKKEIEDWHRLHRPPKTIRTVRFAFNSATTSTLPPSAIFQEVHRGLVQIGRTYDNHLTYTRVEDYYMLTCKLTQPNPDDTVEFEVEVCKVWLLKLHGVRIKRLSGNPFIFKGIYSDFVSALQL